MGSPDDPARRSRQRAVRAAGGGHRHGVHVGGRPAAPHAVAPDVIYELHVKGFTQLNPHVPEELRGTYLGLASEPAIDHLTSLGVTAVELMPVHHHVDEWHLREARPQQLLGLQHARRTSRPTCATPVALAARRGARIQDDGARRCTPRASR